MCLTRSHMTLAAYCCWVISPRYFYHIYNRWGSQTTERGKQSLPLWEDSHFLPCKEKCTKQRSCATTSVLALAVLDHCFSRGAQARRWSGLRAGGPRKRLRGSHVQMLINTEQITTVKNISLYSWISKFRKECFL